MGWKFAVGLLAFASFGLAACDDDEPDAVSQSAYDEKAEELCERHGAVVFVELDALLENPASGADQASFLVADYVPRARAIVRSLDGFGYPEAKAVVYNDAAGDAMEALEEIEEEPLELIDRAAADLLIDEENPFLDVQDAFVAMDIPCNTTT